MRLILCQWSIDTCLRTFSDHLVAWALGETSYDDVTYHTTAENVTGLLQPGTKDINRGESLSGLVKRSRLIGDSNADIAIVTVLTVQVV